MAQIRIHQEKAAGKQETLAKLCPFGAIEVADARLPSYKRKKETADRQIRVLTLDNLPDKDPAHYGLNGSPTQVKRIFPPENSNTREMWEGDADELSGRLFRFLDSHKYLQQLR